MGELGPIPCLPNAESSYGRGKANDALKLSDRVWTCDCGKTHDRDRLAAQNIKRFALHPRNSLRQEMPEFTPEEILV